MVKGETEFTKLIYMTFLYICGDAMPFCYIKLFNVVEYAFI